MNKYIHSTIHKQPAEHLPCQPRQTGTIMHRTLGRILTFTVRVIQ